MTEILDFEFVDGIAFVSNGEKMKLAYHRNLVFFDSKMKDVMSIEYSDITNAEVLTETEEENKSVIGRAIVGGLLLGPVGAVVGGISGTGKKEKNHYFLRITYGDENKSVILKSYDKTPKTCEKAKNLIVDMKNGKKEEKKSYVIKCRNCGEEFDCIENGSINCPKCGFKNDTPKSIKIGCGLLATIFILVVLIASSGEDSEQKTTNEKPAAKQEKVVQTENPVLKVNSTFANGLSQILNKPYKIVDPSKIYYTKSANFKEVYFFGTVVESKGQYYNAIWATNDMNSCGAGLVFSVNDYAIESSGMGDGRTNKEQITNSDDGYSRINQLLIEDMTQLN